MMDAFIHILSTDLQKEGHPLFASVHQGIAYSNHKNLSNY